MSNETENRKSFITGNMAIFSALYILAALSISSLNSFTLVNAGSVYRVGVGVGVGIKSRQGQGKVKRRRGVVNGRSRGREERWSSSQIGSKIDYESKGNVKHRASFKAENGLFSLWTSEGGGAVEKGKKSVFITFFMIINYRLYRDILMFWRYI